MRKFLNHELMRKMYLENLDTIDEIAAAMGTSIGVVRTTLSKMGVKRGYMRMPIALTTERMRYIETEALVRGTTTARLIQQMVNVIAADDLFDAILGTPDECTRVRKIKKRA